MLGPRVYLRRCRRATRDIELEGTNADLQPVNRAVNHDQSCNAEGHQQRGRHESCTQRTGRIKPAMASERDHNVSLKVSRLPASKSAADFHHHGHFEKATTDSA